jgi:4-hydroxy-tetrahydrodipicolinate synthase
MVTAYDDSGAFDPGRMARFTDWQVTEGIHGLIPLGSTGEFLSLSAREREAVARCVVETVAGRVPVLLGAGAECTEDVIENCRMAAAVGADGVMIIPPFYATPTEEELYRHYARISEATELPIMLYNNPATANVDLTPPLVARLSTLRGVDYIKESFVNGAEGWVAVASNILPRDSARLFTLTADRQDYDAARALYARILPVIRLVGGHRYVSATKAALELMGLPTGAPRSPRLPLPEADMPELLAALKAVDLLNLAEA